MTPGAVVALRMLRALGVDTREQARDALIVWCKPSPRLSVLDVTQILAEFVSPTGDTDAAAGEHYHRDDEPTGGPLPAGVEGYAISGRDRKERGDDE